MPRGTVSTACETFQASLRHVWSSGSSITDICAFVGITKDQLIRLRSVMQLPLRLDRSKRCKPPRHKDPTPSQIRAACAALRAKHLEERRHEPADRVYRTDDQGITYRVDRYSVGRPDDPLEGLIDGMG